VLLRFAMRDLLLAIVGSLVAAGCGRVGFDVLDGGVAADAASSVSFASLCELSSHVIIEDGIALDDDVGLQLSQAVEAGCGTTVARRTTSQDDAAAVDAVTGRPLVSADELIVLGGGDGPHRVVRYLLGMDTPLLWEGSPVTIRERSTGRIIAQGPTGGSDLILIQVVTEPVGGTLSLSAQGQSGEGTIAAGIYFEQVISSQLASRTASVWFVLEWTDSDGVAGASPDDTYTLIESG